MTETLSPPRRDVGRPRVFSDEDIFHATDIVLRRDGYQALTLESIASEVGCTRQALVRRFGSKRSLILSFLEGMAGPISELYQAEPDSSEGPMDVLRNRLIRPWGQHLFPTIDPRAQANMLSFVLTLSHEAELATRFTALHELAREGIESLLRSAVGRGELRGIDPYVTSQVLYDAWIGITINWCLDPTIDVTSRLSAMFDLVLDPHRSEPQ
jgi:AcrR family transcriptional regulator